MPYLANTNAIMDIIQNTYKASIELRKAPDKTVKATLLTMATLLLQNMKQVLDANARDLAKQDDGNPRNDRLMLNEQRIRGIANSIRQISRLPNPSGIRLAYRTLPNGLQLEKFAVPLGVVGAVYESRPNVTFDIAALCLRSQNGCLLKGSSEADETNKAANSIIKKALKHNGLPAACVTLMPSDRQSVQQLFTATRYVDVIIPRGSEGLIQYVRKNSQVPVIETGAGVCHVYVQAEADLDKAVDIVVNAKVSRPSVCNAVDTIIVDEDIAPEFLKRIKGAMEQHHVEMFADSKAYRLLKGYAYLAKAGKEDFGREFLSLKCAVKVVKNIDEALDHIRRYSTKHSEAIVSKNKKLSQRFLQEVDAAAVYSNASTRFTDGQKFGLGAEIGISTQKLHARGPFALEKLVTEKWIITGNGQIRT